MKPERDPVVCGRCGGDPDDPDDDAQTIVATPAGALCRRCSLEVFKS